MKTVSMSGSRRESVGKKDAKKHRVEGRVPCVIYGGKEEVHFSLEEKAFAKLLFSAQAFFVKLTIDGTDFNCILKDVQYHPVSDSIIHADFLEYSEDKPITLAIPVKVTGTSPGVIKGGSLDKKFRRLTIHALPKDMPEAIVVDISKMEVNDKITIAQVPQEKFKILERSEQFIVAVRPTRLATGTKEGEAAKEA